MNEQQITRIAAQLEEAFGEDGLTRLGLETGFTERLRQVTPLRLAVSIVGAMAYRSIESIADLQRSFRAVTGCRIEYKPFHNQLGKEAFPSFMSALFQRLLGQLAHQTLAPVPGHVLQRFEDLVIQDGSSFGIHDALQSVFPGRFTNSSPAAVELHTTMSVLSGQPLRVSVAPDAQAEREFLPEPRELRDKLFLADRGYMDLDYCASAISAGASFVIRFTRSANPIITGGTIGNRRISPSILGRRVKDCTKQLTGRSADLEVRWMRGAQCLALRFVLIWNDLTKEHMILATNLPRKDFPSKTVRCLYRLRWQVELLFKEWKSYANLRPYCTRKAPIATGLIWAALCAALLKRFLAHAAQVVVSGVEVSTRIAAMSLSYHLPPVLDAVLRRRSIRGPLEALLEFLASSCRRAHPLRDRKSGRLACGLRPTNLEAGMVT